MVELRWIKMSLFLILGLQFTAVTGQISLGITVRVGYEVTLSCENVMTDQDKCDSTTWLFVGSGSTTAVELIRLGQIGENAKAKSDRLSVTVNCSLVIKKVTVEDVGHYTCRQFKSGQQQGQDSRVYLSVVTMTEHKNTDKVMLSCSVSTYGQCEQTVKWVYEGNYWDVNTQHMKESQSSCFDNVMFTTSRLAETSKYSELFKCSVTDIYSEKVQLFAFSPQSSAVTGQTSLYITVRDGDEVTLSCENVMTDQDKCDSTTWIFSASRNTAAVELINLGQIGENAKAKSDRLSVTANCSLVIKKVTFDDVGDYTCRQIKSDKQQGQDSHVYLSVVTMTEHKNTDKVTLNCSVLTYGQCRQTVKWVYEGNYLDVNTQHMKKSQSSCFVTVMFTTSHLAEMSKYSESFKCNVTDKNPGKVQLFAFSPQSSGEDTKRPATTKSTPIKSTTTTKLSTTTSTSTMKSTRQQDFAVRLRFIIVSVGLAALSITVVSVNIWTRTKGNKTQMDDNAVHNHEDGDEGTVKYENVGEPSASVRLH